MPGAMRILSPIATPIATLWRHRTLAYRLAERDVISRWKGSFLGPFWSLLTPLFMLCVYTFVFGTVLQGRSIAGIPGDPPFALVLLSGLILVQLFAETANVATGVIRANVAFVKQVVFPLEILPFVGFLVALFNSSVTAVVLLAGYLLFHGLPPPTALLVPVVLLPLPFFIIGFAWFVAALGVYMRDTAQITTLVTSVFLFLCPVFYSLDTVPEGYRSIVQWNPLTPVIGGVRAALFSAPPPPLVAWLVSLAIAVALFQFGFWFFRHTHDGFADVV